ncbi:unknown [Firmicutes bacterium CAG:791]|nr:unknown [Firmicutes bacterium CAG:791]
MTKRKGPTCCMKHVGPFSCSASGENYWKFVMRVTILSAKRMKTTHITG